MYRDVQKSLPFVTKSIIIHSKLSLFSAIDRTGIVIDNFDVSPKPIEIPGNISVTLNSRIGRRLPADHHYRLNVTIAKNLLGNWHSIPCLKNVGTW